jgi:hypothetical protein
MFDALLYLKKPDLSQYGFKNILVIYDGSLWNAGETQRDTINSARIISVAKTLPPNSLVCIDIESWPLKGPSEVVTQSKKKYIAVAKLFRENCPTAKIGFYGIVPIRDFWRAIRGEGDESYKDWDLENSNLQEIADTVDVIFPSLYTFYPDQNGWKIYATANIKEARKYGKPVYPFLWPEYHNSNITYGGQLIPADFWRLELMTCSQLADGIVVWGGWQKNWDDNAAWWIETNNFINVRPTPPKGLRRVGI